MAGTFEEILRDKTRSRLDQMHPQPNSFAPYKQQIILDEISTRDALGGDMGVIRSEARKVTQETLEDWFRQTLDGAQNTRVEGVSNEEIIANAIGKLVESGTVAIPRGGLPADQNQGRYQREGA